jgi:hypothetical protein
LTLPTLPLGTTAIFWLRFEFLIDIHFDFSGCAQTWLMSAFDPKRTSSAEYPQCKLRWVARNHTLQCWEGI